MPDTAVTTPTNFEEKMKARIKESIGDLITDEELKRLLDKAMQEVFFAPTKVKVNSWETKEGPSLLHSLVKELIEPSMKEAISVWIAQHPEEVAKAIDTVLTNGVGEAVMAAITSQFHSKLWAFGESLKQQMMTSR